MPALLSRGCAYHDGDMNGPTYNSDGRPCGGMTSEESIYVGAAAGLCGTVLLILAGIYARRLLKARARDKAMKCENARPISSLGTPLITSTFSPEPSRPPLGRLISAPSSDGHSSSSHGPGSPYSSSSEEFHFPILSADGHLLPPPPATSRHSWIDASQSVIRPLPSPPLVQPAILSPIPRTPKRWSYQPTSQSPSPEKVVGLYDGFDRDVGIRSHRVTRVEHGVYRPQTATVHSFSAEGEEILYDVDGYKAL